MDYPADLQSPVSGNNKTSIPIDWNTGLLAFALFA